MICSHIELNIETTEPRDIARAMFKFWHYQYEQAKIKYLSCKNKIEHMKKGNEQCLQDWKKDDEIGLFGPPKAFDDMEIRACETSLPIYEKNLDEAKAMYGYVINYITDRAHPVKETPCVT